jgi:hypothetical protein
VVRVLGAGIVLAAATIWVAAPPRPLAPQEVDWMPARPVVRGAYHVHTVRSDGSGTWQEVAEAAARAGLDFVVFTDHGNGTEPREPPRYHAGVLCLDGVEISTWAGHYVAVPDHAAPAPYPLAGEPRAVVEDVARFFGDAGLGIVAHPGSPREPLRWTEWDLPFDGIEWLNADSEWRDEGARLGRTLLTYWFRPVESITALVSRPASVLDAWDRLTEARAVRALAGHDAHARLAWRGTDPYEGRVGLRLPPYEISFRAFSNHVVLDRPFSGEPSSDALLLLHAIGRGAVYTTLDGRASAGPFEFTATTRDGATAPMGEWLRAPLQTVDLRARLGAPGGTRVVILRGGDAVADAVASEVSAAVSTSGAYRVEAYLPDDRGRHVPWLLSNPIYVDVDDRYVAAFDGGVGADPWTPREEAAVPIVEGEWQVEVSPGSRLEAAAARRGEAPPGVRLTYTLAAGAPSGQYAALRLPAPPRLNDWTHLAVVSSADHHARAWVQLRRHGGTDGERWGRSVVIGQGRRTEWLPLAALGPIGLVTEREPPLAAVDDVLIVIDTVNTPPGAHGTFVVWSLHLGR